MNHFNILSDEKRENKNPTINSMQQQDRVVQVAKVGYEDVIITIFTDSAEKNPVQFYYQPLALLDPKSIVRESNGFLKQEFVRFTVQMWNQELRSKVLDRLRSLPSLKDHKIQEDDVHVMPYEEIQLLFKPNSVHQASIELFNEPTPYVLLNETLDFYLLCESAPIANLLAQDLRRNPGSTLKGLQLVMECRGLSLGNAVNSAIPKRPIFTFNLSAITKEPQNFQYFSAAYEIESDDMLTVTHINEMIPVPVFGAADCCSPEDIGGSIYFLRSSFPNKFEYGNFALQRGIFYVVKPGIYQFTFSALQEVAEDGYLTNIELRVDGVKKGEFLSQSDWKKEEYEPIFISSTLTLKQGQEVGIFLTDGELYPASLDYPTRFSGIFFSD